MLKSIILATALTITTFAAQADTYVTKYGDTFLGIANRNGMTYTQLRNVNPSVSPEVMKAGTKLQVFNLKPKEVKVALKPIAKIATPVKANTKLTKGLVEATKIMQVPQTKGGMHIYEVNDHTIMIENPTLVKTSEKY